MATDAQPKLSSRHYLSPKYWPTWTGIGLMRLVAQLPFRVQLRLGRSLGRLAFRFAIRRRKVCERNIQLCFPSLSGREQNELVRRTFESNGIGLVEVAISWFSDLDDYRDRFEIDGLENLVTAVSRGKGVLLVCAHYSTLELGGALLSMYHSLGITYRKHSNPVFQYVMTKYRSKHFGAVIEREDVRSAIRYLQQGNVLWFAPDQDYGARHSVFVPFFGVEAATLTATGRFARMGNSTVIFFSHHRREDGSGYQLTLSTPLEDFPSGNVESDAMRINQLVQSAVVKFPDQYVWLHKRFKTQRAGNPSVYE